MVPSRENHPSANPMISSFPSESSLPTEHFSCFSQWKDLSDAIKEIANKPTGGLFSLCSNSLFDLQVSPSSFLPPIEIKSRNIKIQCGANVTQAENCIIFKGNIQFRILDSGSDIEFRGITFFGSNDVAMFAGGGKDTNATFLD